MDWETVIALAVHAQLLNAAHQYQTVTGWHRFVAEA
jgi:hypothetical protein